MKQLLFAITIILSAFSVSAQNIFNTTGDGFLDGRSLIIERPITTGGWATGLTFQQRDSSTKLGSFGMLGSSNNVRFLYIAHGETPWNSKLGLYVKPNGFVGIGTTNPVATNESNSRETVFHVKNTTSSGNVEVARFEGGTDANNTGAIVRINHANDRGLYLKGGRRVGDRSYGELGVIGTAGNLESPSIAFDDAGNVGIGTVNPEGPLHITGGAFSTIFSGNNIQFSRDNGPAYIWSKNPGGYMAFGTNGRGNSNANSNLVLKSDQNSYFNGNVGVGTTNPTYKLDVNGSTARIGGNVTGARLRVEASDEKGAPASTVGIELRGYEGRGKGLFITDKNTSHKWFIGEGYNYQGIGIGYSSSNQTEYSANAKFFVGTNGNVGIGTTDTKGFKLGVNGKIAATEVKVAKYNNWPDFVFEDKYNLPSLNEVENHINEKGHLKNIPSAKEVGENGFFLGNMNAKLLQKIEELTLYTIQQEKKLQASKADAKSSKEAIKNLETKNITLENRLANLEALVKGLDKN